MFNQFLIFREKPSDKLNLVMLDNRYQHLTRCAPFFSRGGTHVMSKENQADRLRRWETRCLEPFLKKYPERKKKFKNLSGTDIKICYTPSDLSVNNFEYNKDLGFPGEYPYTRSIYPTLYRGKLWTMRQFAGLGTADDTNQRFKYLIANGQTGLSVAFHLPTLYGYESGTEMTLGEIGKEGVAIDTLADMETLFDGIDLSSISSIAEANLEIKNLFSENLSRTSGYPPVSTQEKPRLCASRSEK